MAPLWGKIFWTAYLGVENQIIAQILKIPAFHHAVRKVHRTVEDLKYGRDPLDPLRPGEATEDPEKVRPAGFFRYFAEELRNQFRGTPTEPPPPPPPSAPRK